MAQRARLVFLRLVVERRYPGNIVISRYRVTLQAQEIHLADTKHSWIRRPVRHVATGAALGAHRNMFEHEWTLFIGVTFVANLLVTRRRLQLPRNRGAMRIVAVRAGQQAFVDTVPERH